MRLKKEEAKKLRKKGYSFREISQALSISKSTASIWTREEVLDNRARVRLKLLGDIGRAKAKETIRRKQEKILEEIDKSCQVLKDVSYNKNDLKLILAALYWGEGEKRGGIVNFVNSDSDMISLYLMLLRNCYHVDEDRLRVRLHLHNYHNKELMIDFWSKVTGIGKNSFSVYNKPHTGKNKKPGYKGCLSIRYGDSRIIKEIFIIIDRLRKFNIAGLV